MKKCVNKRAGSLIALIAGILLVFPSASGASNCLVDPAVPASGHPVTVIYDPAAGPLDSATNVCAHRSTDYWSGAIDDPAMTRSNGVWVLTYLCPQWVNTLDFVFHDGAGTWDNNSGNDWHFSVPLPTVGAAPALPQNGSSARVMMQGFYWDCPQGWYGNMSANAASLRYMRGGQGIDRIWFPPPQKADGGGYSMGYDPYDYYDLGQIYQQGSTATRFGTQEELKSSVAAYKELGVVCMADMVLNHRSGGLSQSNPNTTTSTYTDFGFVGSGKCTWNYSQFHPCVAESYDEGAFEGFPDICHVTGFDSGSACYDLIEWGAWLTNSANAGFDGGWRFDYPKGINPSFIADFRKGSGNAFGILEYWDSNISTIENYAAHSGDTAAFDFPAFYTMIDVFNHEQHIGRLIDSSRIYAVAHPDRAVTFVANHDTDKDAGVEDIGDKMLAYAYILTYQGYPCIFWKDYYDYGLATLGGQDGNGIDPLVWVRGALGGGQPEIEVLKADNEDLLIYGTENGSLEAPGYIVVINNHDSSTLSATVSTSDPFLHEKDLQCHAWYSYVSGQNIQPANVFCSAGGSVTVQAPPRGYAVYSIDTSLPTPPWTTTDVGEVECEGSAAYYSDTYTIAGGGSDIGGIADGFRYVYRYIAGDCAIQARVTSVSETGSNSKAGVMVRKKTLDYSVNASVLVSADDGVVFQWRSDDEGATESVNVPGVTAPCWVRLVRTGTAVRGFYSTDGDDWSQIGTVQTISLTTGSRTGLAVSGGDEKVAIAHIDQVSVNQSPAISPTDDLSIVAGNTLVLTNVVSDVDDPAQTLTCSLVAAPEGAVFNGSGAIFEWRPRIDQSPSTQTVCIVVSDDGVPSMSATNCFSVEVIEPAAPSFSSVGITNGAFSFSVDGDHGPDYSILRSTNLLNGIWQPLISTNSPSLPFSFSAPTSGVPQEFYKVELGP